MKEVRRKKIANYITLRHNVTMDELVKKFGVSMNTIRADVAYLVNVGAAIKVYGGVQSPEEQPVAHFTSRLAQNQSVKKAIAQKAAGFIEDGDVIYIDAGTTAMYLPDFIPPQKHVTILTPNLYVITNASNKVNIKLFVLPGELDRRTNSLKATPSYLEMSNFRIQKAFMACSGVTTDARIAVSTYLECEIKKNALEKSVTHYLLADSSKFSVSSLLFYGSLSQIDVVFSDQALSADMVAYCHDNNISLVLV